MADRADLHPRPAGEGGAAAGQARVPRPGPRFLAEGPQAVREAAGAAPASLLELFATAEAADRHPDLVAGGAGAGVPVDRASRRGDGRAAQTVTPQGLVGVCALRRRRRSTDAPRPRRRAWSRCSRTCATPATRARSSGAADAAGAEPSCSPTPQRRPATTPRRAGAAGSACSTCRSSTGARGRGRRRRRCGSRAAGARRRRRGRARPRRPRRRRALARPTAWVFGNEAWGLPEETRALADEVVAGPDPRPGREPQPRHRRRGLPLRLGPRPALPVPDGPPPPAPAKARVTMRLGAAGRIARVDGPVVDREKLTAPTRCREATCSCGRCHLRQE